MSFTISTNAPLTDYSGLLKEGMSRIDLKQYEDLFYAKPKKLMSYNWRERGKKLWDLWTS